MSTVVGGSTEIAARKIAELREKARRIAGDPPPNAGKLVTWLSFLPLLLSLGMVAGHEIQHVGGLEAMMTTEFLGSAMFAVCHEGLAWLSGAGVATGIALRINGKQH